MQENQNEANRSEGEENPHTSAEKLNQTAQNAAAESPEKAVKADAAAAENSAQNAAEKAPNGAQNAADNAAPVKENGARKTPETAAKISETAPQGGQGNGQSAAVIAADEPDLRYKNKKEVAKGGVLVFFIGLAVIVPGVSGSAVAIIFRL